MNWIMFFGLFSLILIILIFLMLNLKYIVNRIRKICLRPDGYVKFIQTIYVLFIITSFTILMIYFILKPGETNKLDIFLTVVVGAMGTIVGFFFSDITMKMIKESMKDELVGYAQGMKKILSKIEEKYKEKNN